MRCLILIIEGGDLVGKTTLCKKLLDDPLLRAQGYVYSHFSRLPPGFDYGWDYLARASRKIVQDRFHMSEQVYARVRGEEPRTTPATPERYRWLDGKLRELGAFTVVVVCEDDELIRERYRVGEMYDVEKCVAANRGFHFLLRNNEGDADVDLVLRTNRGNPFVTDDDVALILTNYLERQDFISEHHRRRPAVL